MELTSNVVQTVNANGNVVFITTRIPGNCSVIHTEGSGNIKMRGLSNNQCRSRFKVTFTGNIAVPTGGTAGAISLTITIDGEAVRTAQMIVTPAELHHDQAKKLKELEEYMQELNADILEMIEGASQEEKQLLQKKIALLATKINV